MEEKIRVQKIISSATNYSRRKAETLIEEGRVKVNNVIIKLGDQAHPEKDEIRIDNEVINKPRKKIYLLMNKPAGVVTSTYDPHEKTIMSLLPKKYSDQGLFPAGRLDKETEGLIIITNDGDFSNKVTHPSNNVKKTYEGETKHILTGKELSKLRTGIKLEEGLAKCEIKVNHTTINTQFEIIIQTGWTRQIRRMFQELDHEIHYLRRIKIGNLELNELEDKQLKEYTLQELTRKIH